VFAPATRRSCRWASQDLSLGELQRQLSRLKNVEQESAGVKKLKEALLALRTEAEEKERSRQSQKAEWQYYVVHATGPDKVGMSAEVSEVVSRWAADIEASRSTILGGDFSMMMHVRVRKDKLDDLTKALEALPEIDVTMNICEGEMGTGSGRHAPAGRQIVSMAMQGGNRPGIIAGITRFLESRGVDLRNVASELLPGTDGDIFTVRFVVDAPVELTALETEAGIRALGQVLSVNLELTKFKVRDSETEW